MIDRPEIGQPPREEPEIKAPTPDRIGPPDTGPEIERPPETPLETPVPPLEDPLELPSIPGPVDPDDPNPLPDYNPPREPYA